MCSHSIPTTGIVDGLNNEQTAVFLECTQGTGSVFCTGRGGTGKSRVTETVIEHFNMLGPDSGIQVAVTASTGVSAFQIRGITLHRFAGVGITENDKDAMLKSALKGKSASYWRSTNVLIIDEISMISGVFFNNLSYVAQKIRRSDEPFGGIRLLMFGDFLQLPPVSRSARSMRVFESDTWKEMNPRTYELKEILRQRDLEFTSMVSKVRLGECDDEVIQYFKSLSREVEYDDSIEPVVLYSLRRTTDEYNMKKLNELTGGMKSYESIDSGDARSLAQCPAPKIVHLKYGCQVMLTRNISAQAVNGSVGTVIGFRYVSTARSFQPLVKFVDQNSIPFTMCISRALWETVAPDGLVVSSRSQIPLILAWATTIHKSQGQTIPRLCVDLESVFEYGQAYVALSRCTDPVSLQVLNFSKEIARADSECVSYYRNLEECATTVALATAEQESTSWDSQASNTLLALEQLSIRETSESSHSDSAYPSYEYTQ